MAAGGFSFGLGASVVNTLPASLFFFLLLLVSMLFYFRLGCFLAGVCCFCLQFVHCEGASFCSCSTPTAIVSLF